MKQKICIILLILFTLSLCDKTAEVKDDPASYSWDDMNGVTYLGPVKNQNFPFACNSGWAFATIGMLETRIKKKRTASTPDISLSTQVLLTCDTFDYGCLGGQPINALRYMKRTNITDQSCHGYLARGYTQGQKCTSETKCQKCINGTCKGQANSKLYRVGNYGTISGQQAIMTQLQTHGPTACGISVTPQFQNYTTGIFNDKSSSKGINHYVLIYGWGIENGTKYWLARNSWGSAWGQSGNFRIVKGSNNLGIETLCYWGSLWDTWTDDVRNQTVPSDQGISKVQILNTKVNNVKAKITYPLPKLLTSSKSILTPQYCQSSWAFSIVQMFKDRISLNSKGKISVDFSVQALLNCGLGQCSTQTDPFQALSYINKYGVPEQNCQNYKGQKPVKQNCTGIFNCATCSGTAFSSTCSQVKNFKRWKTKDFGTLSGEKDMMTQITNFGPIVCGIDKNSTVLQNYNGGIISETSVSPKINHYVQVVGFGSQAGKNYWIVRNFWGTAWGQEGFFRIQRAGNNLGIQKRCLWANFAL